MRALFGKRWFFVGMAVVMAALAMASWSRGELGYLTFYVVFMIFAILRVVRKHPEK